MDGDGHVILTIGHSNHTIEVFVNLLIGHAVTAIADVRSNPYSRFNPQFNRERFSTDLEARGIRYVYMGSELGGRPDGEPCHEEGGNRYDRMARTPRFRDGLARLVRGARKFRIALMCAEQEPLHCHRTLLVGHELASLGIDVTHILPDGLLESHDAAMSRLLAKFNLADDDLLYRHMSRSERISQAIGYAAHRPGRRNT